jgi:beta-aspartyl-peptidase (threonine type)
MKTILWIFVALLISQLSVAQQDNLPIAIAIHGGAGTIRKANMTDDMEKAYQEKLNEALQAGYTVLQDGGTSTEAVVAAIKIMEDSELFNAGKGAVFTSDGRNELDAAIMEGKNRNAGTVAGITTVKNPVTAAVAVMNNSPHVMMIGKGAEKFAAEQGLEIVDSTYFYTERRFQQLQKIRETEKQQLDHSENQGSLDIRFPDRKFGTVGCVALDASGNLAAATSTGGMTNKKYGRVGDVPIIGAGTYADNQTCAVSATGHGEYFIRSVVAYDISALMKYKGMSVTEATDEVVNHKLVEMEGSGGVIAIDGKGNIAMPFNTSGMYRGAIDVSGKMYIGIYGDE